MYGAAPTTRGALPEGLAHQLFGPRIVGEPFLRKHADLEVHRPAVRVGEPLDRVEPGEADAGVDLDVRAHMRRAVDDRLLEDRTAAREHVVVAELPLDLRHFGNRLLERATLGLAAVEDARLVEMEVRLDETGHDEVSTKVDLGGRRGEPRRQRRHLAVGDADVERSGAIAE